MVKKYFKYFLGITMVFNIIFLSGCNAFKKTESSEGMNYNELKQMVIDILQTEDGKKAINESLSAPKIKKQMIIDNKEVEKIIQTEFFSSENNEKLKSMFEDPKFASQLAKSLEKENKKLLKDLMKDPEYRKMLIETMKDQEFEKMMLDIMKSNAYRKQMMLVIKESLESPLFKADLLKLMEKAGEEALKPEKKKEEKDASQQEGEQ